MNQLKITLIQADLIWEDIQANLLAFQKKIDTIEASDLIVLPEMFSSGFSMQPERFSKKDETDALSKMQEWAKSKNAALMGSLIAEEKGQFFNRAYFVFPDGSYKHYDKRHLFRMGKEDTVYTAGNEAVCVEYKDWKIRPFICYDLRFPVWSRNTQQYDLAIYVANWPTARTAVWESLLKARAIENQAYVVGVNRIGDDGKGIAHSGASSLIDFKGESLFRAKDNREAVQTISIEKDALQAFRDKFPAHLDADQFEIQ